MRSVVLKWVLIHAALAAAIVVPGLAVLDHMMAKGMRSERDALLLGHARVAAELLAAAGGAAPDSAGGFAVGVGTGRGGLDPGVPHAQAITALDPLADRLAAATGTRVTFIAPNGRVVGDSSLDPAAILTVDPHGTRSEIHDAVERGVGVSSRVSHTTGEFLRYAAVPIQVAGGTAVVRLAVPVEEAETRIRAARWRLLIGAGGFLVAWLVMSFAAARVFFSPLRQIARSAAALAAGSIPERIRVRSADEIGQLAHALDRLASGHTRDMGHLDREKEQLRGVLEGMAEGVLLLDEEGRIVLANPAATASLPRRESALGRTPLEITRSVELDELVRRARKQGAPGRGQVTLGAGATGRILDASAIPLAGRKGGLILVLHDISEIKRLEVVRREFVANVSHELRTPLTAIIGFIDTLNDEPDLSEEERRRFLGAASRNAQRLSNLVHDLLTLAKIDSPEYQLALIPCNLAEEVEHVLEQHATRARERNLRLEAAVGPDLPPVLADASALGQVLSNLIDNAIKYNRGEGSVVVRAVKAGDWAQVTGEDAGLGIGPSHLSRIFERLYRVDPGRSREEGGTGLGLAIVKHLVLKHGGEVWVKSDVGRGSTFGFSLRLADKPEGGPDASGDPR